MNLKLSPDQFNTLKEYSRYKGKLVFEDEEEDFDPFDHSALYEPDAAQAEPDRQLLRLNVKGNAKIRHPYISLPAGWTCPGALFCKAKADPVSGKITDGKGSKFRCYAASDESRYPNLRGMRWTNFELLKACQSVTEMADLIILSIRAQMPLLPKVFRLHESGDFFNQLYFDAWISVAAQLPEVIFYTYTKAINYWVKRKGQIPPNLKLNGSLGGAYDKLIFEHGLKYVDVVWSVEEAIEKRLPLDKDDSLAWKQDRSFAVLLHGVQPKGSEAADALKKLRDSGVKGYSKGNLKEDKGDKDMMRQVKRFKAYFKGKNFMIDGYKYEFQRFKPIKYSESGGMIDLVYNVYCSHGNDCQDKKCTNLRRGADDRFKSKMKTVCATLLPSMRVGLLFCDSNGLPYRDSMISWPKTDLED